MVSPRISPQAADAPVAGQDDGGFEVALGDDLEQCGGGFGGQGQVAQFVDDQEAGSGEESHGGGPASFDGGAVAAGGEVGGGGEVGAVAGFGGRGPGRRRMVFPTPGGPISRTLVAMSGSGRWPDRDEVRVNDGGGVVVEVRQGGRGGQGGEPEPAGEGGLRWRPRSRGAVPARRSRSGLRPGGVQDGGQRLGGVVSFSADRWPRSCW